MGHQRCPQPFTEDRMTSASWGVQGLRTQVPVKAVGVAWKIRKCSYADLRTFSHSPILPLLKKKKNPAFFFKLTINHFILFIYFWPWHVACGISVPRPWTEPRPWQWKPGILTIRPPGNSQNPALLSKLTTEKIKNNHLVANTLLKIMLRPPGILISSLGKWKGLQSLWECKLQPSFGKLIWQRLLKWKTYAPLILQSHLGESFYQNKRTPYDRLHGGGCLSRYYVWRQKQNTQKQPKSPPTGKWFSKSW